MNAPQTAVGKAVETAASSRRLVSPTTGGELRPSRPLHLICTRCGHDYPSQRISRTCTPCAIAGINAYERPLPVGEFGGE
jgi:hypothetical protein